MGISFCFFVDAVGKLAKKTGPDLNHDPPRKLPPGQIKATHREPGEREGQCSDRSRVPV